MAILVTGITAVLLLVAAMMLAHHTGSFSIPVALESGGGTLVTTATALILVAGLAKCAQMPLHFWLPRAMAAPTPVSAYLHSAAMVAAGVFLIARFSPLVALDGALGDVLIAVGLVSGVVAGIIALTRDDLKQLLAYSTIAQYGYVVFLLGIGGPAGAGAAAVYVLAHGPAKSALFLVAGTVTEATGERRLSRLGGLARRMPLLAVAAGTSAATLAALPLTVGFFKDELLFAAARDRGAFYAVAAVALAVLTFGYAWRFFAGVFLGPVRAESSPVSRVLVWPPVVLGVITVVAGFWLEPVNRLASEAGTATLRTAVDVHAAYHLTSVETLLALVTYVLGAGLIVTHRYWARAAAGLAHAGAVLGPARWYRGTLAVLARVSTDIHDIEQRDLRGRVASVLIPSGCPHGGRPPSRPPQRHLTAPQHRRRRLLAHPRPRVRVRGRDRHDAPRAITSRCVLILATVGLNLALAYAFFAPPTSPWWRCWWRSP